MLNGFGVGGGVESIDRVAEVLLNLGSFASDFDAGVASNGGFGADFGDDVGDGGDRLGTWEAVEGRDDSSLEPPFGGGEFGLQHFEVFRFEGDELGNRQEEFGEGIGGGENGVGALPPAEDAVFLGEVTVGVGCEDQDGSSESLEAEGGEVVDLGFVENQEGGTGKFGIQS